MKVKDLINDLENFDPETYVAVTWEGIIVPDLWLYTSIDGVLLIDANEDFSWNKDKYPKEVLKYFRDKEE